MSNSNRNFLTLRRFSCGRNILHTWSGYAISTRIVQLVFSTGFRVLCNVSSDLCFIGTMNVDQLPFLAICIHWSIVFHVLSHLFNLSISHIIWAGFLQDLLLEISSKDLNSAESKTERFLCGSSQISIDETRNDHQVLWCLDENE